MDSPADPPAEGMGRLIAGPDLGQEARGEQLGQRPGVDPVGLGPEPRRRLGRLGVGQHDPGMRLQDPRDRERVAGRLEGDGVVGSQAAGERLDLGRRGADPAGAPDPTSLGDRALAEVAMDVQPDRAHGGLLPLRVENRRANDTYGYVLTAHPGGRRGGQLQIAGSRPIWTTACPACVLPEPLSRD